ncbi:MAG: hypothetical protein ABS68_09205 [Niastella sp. SCN 39-18]|nr:MAG: hypothetical protein ABS68_09205 [Niastella sp. SCN 39-18]
MQQFVHYFLHLVFPAVLALFINKDRWVRIYFILLATMLVDIDHLLTSPIFDACRCSIGFHPLHSYFAVILYILLLIPKLTRLVAAGLLLHMLADYIDCFFIRQACI